MRKTSAVHRRPSAGTTETSSLHCAGGSVSLRFTGSLAQLSSDDAATLFDRSTSSDASVRSRVADIVARVRATGDDALREMALEFDGVRLETLEVPRTEWDAALHRIALPVRRALERSARNIASVHRAFMPVSTETSPEPGVIVGRRPDALGRVGVYAPGGRAAYPSSVLMGAVPARVAGVGEVILCSPPDPATGQPSDVVLAAAALSGVNRVFAAGGAGAIAAMAYGTTSISRVDRIVGPGNAYVAEAKLQVSGAVAIDAPAGPSEILLLADTTADPRFIAREMMGQAEHDPVACAVAVIYPASGELASADAAAQVDALARDVERALADALPAARRQRVIKEALAAFGGVLTAGSEEQAIGFANRYAAEHVVIAARAPDEVLPQLRNAGTVFVGSASSNAFGDYMTGANHVLPTGGLARSYSGLSLNDFFRWTTYQRLDRAAASAMAEDVGILADAEGLPGHAAAARAFLSPEPRA